MTVFHTESAGDCAKLDEAQPLIQMSCMDIAFNDSIELQHPEAQGLSPAQAVKHQFFADVPPPCLRGDRIACVADMPAPSDIVGMKDV